MFFYTIFSFSNDWSCIYGVQKLYEFQDVQEKIVMLSVRLKFLKQLHFIFFIKFAVQMKHILVFWMQEEHWWNDVLQSDFKHCFNILLL